MEKVPRAMISPIKGWKQVEIEKVTLNCKGPLPIHKIKIRQK
jgi:hypothetical protein